ncbi:MAG: hypothetical protein WDN24_13440 [Sphingomonas sp.]
MEGIGAVPERREHQFGLALEMDLNQLRQVVAASHQRLLKRRLEVPRDRDQLAGDAEQLAMVFVKNIK